jgi:hypothetical protein
VFGLFGCTIGKDLGAGQRLKFVVLPLNALMLSDIFASGEDEMKSILYYYYNIQR